MSDWRSRYPTRIIKQVRLIILFAHVAICTVIINSNRTCRCTMRVQQALAKSFTNHVTTTVKMAAASNRSRFQLVQEYRGTTTPKHACGNRCRANMQVQ